MNIRRWMMSNGLWVVVKEMPHTPLVGASLHIKGGSRVDSPNASGLAHFLEHVFFKGTEKYPTHEALDDLIEADGGRWNAATSHERILCFTSVFCESLEKAFDAISQMAFCPLFRQEDIDVERGPVIEEINQKLDAPDECADELYQKIAWGGHPLSRSILGLKESIGTITRGDFLEYHKNYFYPGNMVLSIAGGISAEKVFALCSKYFYEGKFMPRTELSSTILNSEERFMVEDRNTSQTNAIVGTKAINWISHKKETLKNTLAASLLFNVLGGSTRLFKKVRADRGLVYTIYSHTDICFDGGTAYTYFAAEPEKAKMALKITLDEYDNVLKNGITEDELKRAKLAGRRCYAEVGESSLNTALALGSFELNKDEFGEFIEPLDFFDSCVEPITVDDLMSVAPALLGRTNLCLALVGKVDCCAEEFEQILLS
ncbi:hypothetical protein A2926_02045 [Candidatus Giovannonibacteria bacterium RIFCSPLOWO2_01_FULL_44_40]|uniref:Peptidase M16 n=1 Tax=Candidatus Giovannonibacteria bacterium RIFCSPHIGHO2_01_FULL_45_23 TaxID=1798325 RepID=A0A1F5VFB6_9BACT|nr:MAG: hypothetical protein A2834_02255 [Candidatus Giovannonibacteria bacterium RIFCSPHIGHO2_01_FULL_45_23]OGF75040.1 MAG: hypothetical protein A3C77_02570 [Candidatus Giovannonibacteria bacterium RIFCSPHIGHO2_02_FULL_45_13]OGF80350.1 MAG: hypothetical protein A2926_02045 [Candidatus Giovannonibacteria bacterium RIFCSPLOWO2_01_FULL_44_40]